MNDKKIKEKIFFNRDVWESGAGETLNFVIIFMFIVFMVTFVIAFYQLSHSLNEITKVTSVVGRAAAVSIDKKSAEKTANNLRKMIITDSNVKSSSVTLENVTSPDNWEAGDEILVTVTAKIKTVNPFVSGTRSRKTLVTLENEAGYVAWMEKKAEDSTCGYNNGDYGACFNHGQFGDYDCGGFVSAALQQSGIFGAEEWGEPNGEGATCFETAVSASPLGQMLQAHGFTKHVFVSVDELQRGDIVFGPGHVEVYCGNGMFVGACNNSQADIDAGYSIPGDQNGREVQKYSGNGGYTAYYRLSS